MMKLIKIFIPEILKNFIRNIHLFYFDGWAVKSYSQEGEDLQLWRILNGKKNGFYVDVGSHHPMRFSNTYLFYKQGWKGINIDATPGSMTLFNKYRKNDINLEIGVDLEPAILDYYIFNEPALNSFSRDLSNERNNENNAYKIVSIEKVKVEKLSNILDELIGVETKIDFLTVDVEGIDLRVLKSNDWKKYRPKIVIVEILKTNLRDIEDDQLNKFMKSQNYEAFAKTVNTVFFKDNLINSL